MKYFLLVLIAWFCLGSPSYAFSPDISVISVPYEIITLAGDPQMRNDFLGELADYPIMYEINASEPFILSAYVRQAYQSGSDPIPFSLIAIRKNDKGGVTEVMRLKPSPADWRVVKDKQVGLTFWESPELSKAVEAGTYRLEISTPENHGRYLISFGQAGDEDGCFSTLSGIRTTQKFFGHSFFKMLSSSYVYYPFGIILLLLALSVTWRYRKYFSHAT